MRLICLMLTGPFFSLERKHSGDPKLRRAEVRGRSASSRRRCRCGPGVSAATAPQPQHRRGPTLLQEGPVTCWPRPWGALRCSKLPGAGRGEGGDAVEQGADKREKRGGKRGNGETQSKVKGEDGGEAKKKQEGGKLKEERQNGDEG